MSDDARVALIARVASAYTAEWCRLRGQEGRPSMAAAHYEAMDAAIAASDSERASCPEGRAELLRLALDHDLAHVIELACDAEIARLHSTAEAHGSYFEALSAAASLMEALLSGEGERDE